MRRGRGFSYRKPTGARVTDAGTLERVAGLAIPPAWKDVWICPWPNGHVQATGTDAAGRRQYRYHDAWRRHRDREKYARVLELGRSIDGLRARVRADLASEGTGRTRVLAAVVRLLDIGCFRIGGEQYALENETYGAVTLRREHVHVRGDEMTFSFPAKGGKWQTFVVHDPDVLPVVTTLARRRSRGDELFCFKHGGRWRGIRSDDVNAYIKAAAGGDYSAKDLRTWSATVLAAARLATVGAPPSRTARRRAVAAVVRDVAQHLGDTPAVCRGSYVDPRVVDRFEHDETIPPPLAAAADGAPGDLRLRSEVDAAVVALLDEEPAPPKAA